MPDANPHPVAAAASYPLGRVTASLVPERTAIVVIDPQRAFLDSEGSFARAFGDGEIAEIRAGFRRLVTFLRGLPSGVQVLATCAEYDVDPGRGVALAELCTHLRRLDREIAADFPTDTAGWRWFAKHAHSAWSEEAFRRTVTAVVDAGVGEIIVCGFTLTTCVSATASDLTRFERRVHVRVYQDLTGARLSSYVSPDGPSQVEATLAHLAAVGVTTFPPGTGFAWRTALESKP